MRLSDTTQFNEATRLAFFYVVVKHYKPIHVRVVKQTGVKQTVLMCLSLTSVTNIHI